MTKLERRCRMLMFAYPAAYRRERAEEMLGTLLEATPEGRAWPLPRDIRALLTGGLRTRLTPKRQLTLGVNLRISACAGLAAYLATIAFGNLAFFTRAAWDGSWTQQIHFSGWPYLVVTALMALTVVLAMADGRRVVVLAGAVPAAALLLYAWAGPWHDLGFRGAASLLTCLAALLVLVGRRARLAHRWLWPLGLIVVAPMLSAYLQPRGGPIFVSLLVAVGVFVVASIPFDARPAIAACVLVLVYWLPIALPSSASGPLALVPAGIAIAVAALAAWRLRSQSVGSARRRI